MSMKYRIPVIKRNLSILVVAVSFFIFSVICPIFTLAGSDSMDDNDNLTTILSYIWAPPSELVDPNHPSRQQKWWSF